MLLGGYVRKYVAEVSQVRHKVYDRQVAQRGMTVAHVTHWLDDVCRA